jgi:dihydrofolate synthase/folylpolyglutamate synthase
LLTYADSVQYLYSIGNEIKTAKLGLERIRAILEHLGHPERRFAIVHVAGTNGKGSTCAMIEASLRQAGHRTGLYISPHLVEPTERIQVDGQPVSQDRFLQAFTRVREAATQLLDRGVIDSHPTYFETVTAMAFVEFADRAVDWAVVEVGLGGRLDATNVVEPKLCVITPVDFDHEHWLGNSLSLIAGEKAGILKTGVPAVVAPQHREAWERIREVASVVEAPLIPVDLGMVAGLEIDSYGCSFSVGGARVQCPLAGEHQVTNALTAALALKYLGISWEGIALARWPGRLERVADSPDIILDGAHNPAGARALAAHIRRFYEDRKLWLVYATMRDKSVDETTGILSGLAAEVVLTQVDLPRALRPEVLVDMFDSPRVRVAETVGAALSLVRGEAAADDLILITGSLFLVGEARRLLVP